MTSNIERGHQADSVKPPPSPFSPPWSTTTKVVVIVLGLLLLGMFLQRFHVVAAPLVIAFLIAYVLAPVVSFVVAHTRIPTTWVTGLIYLLFVGISALAIALLAPVLVRQVLAFQVDFLTVAQDVRRFFSQPIQIGTLTLDITMFYDDMITTVSSMAQPLATQTVVLLAGIVQVVVQVILIGIVSFYFTRDGTRMGSRLMEWVPLRWQYDVRHLLRKIDAIWRAFFRGQLLLALTMGTTVGGLMAIVGMRNALILGILAFFLEFLPSLGHGIWLLIAVPLALFQGSSWLPISNFWFGVLVLGIHIVLQQVDINIFIPRIVGRQVNLHPVVVIVGIIVGGTLAGVLGMLLAAPTIASLVSLITYVYRKLLDLPPWPEVALAGDPYGDAVYAQDVD